jgi:hypothetical protein
MQLSIAGQFKITPQLYYHRPVATVKFCGYFDYLGLSLARGLAKPNASGKA